MAERNRAETWAGGEGGSVVLHEEELRVEKTPYQAGSITARKRVDTERVETVVPREFEETSDVERVAVVESDSGEIETLPDGSVSIPVFEEELVITKRMVVRERVIIRKRTITEHHRVEADLLRERVEVEADPGVNLTQE